MLQMLTTRTPPLHELQTPDTLTSMKISLTPWGKMLPHIGFYGNLVSTAKRSKLITASDQLDTLPVRI